MLDWRYEGIILGYIELYRKTRGAIWLDKARRAGLDLVHGQYPCGNFKNSSFERGPTSGGTPHEASADVGLLNLAELLKEEDDPSWSIFYDSAAKNIELYLIKYLWNGEFFRDLPNSNFHVANKTATMVEVMLAYHQFLRHIDEHRAQSILKLIKKAADSILALQQPHGGIAQSSRRRDCYTFYTARCIWPLIQFYKVDDHERYREAAKKAGDFILGMARPEGGFYQVRYYNGKVGKLPVWIAACGDILHALSSLGNRANIIDENIDWILKNQDDCGGIRMSHGFGFWARDQKHTGWPHFGDVLHVCGWNDKAFRFLAGQLLEDCELPDPAVQSCQIECIFNGKRAIYYEDEDKIAVRSVKDQEDLYRWNKKDKWSNL